MRWGEQITLIALSDPSPSTNEHGFPVASIETATTVFADKKSVGFSEFYKALKTLKQRLTSAERKKKA